MLVENISEQGPYGGHTAMYWKSKTSYSFDTNELIDFASRNGWSLMDSLTFESIQTTKWIYGTKEIFPLSHTGFNNTLKNISTYNHFPRWFDGPVKLYKFKTGWITIEPGTDNSIEENGFILFNQNKNEIAVYHLWGE